MVFTTSISLFRWPKSNKGPDEFWRKRKIFRIAASFFGRRRNCYSITIVAVIRSLWNATKGRTLKKRDMRQLRTARVDAGCVEHGLTSDVFLESLQRCNIFLDRKVLADLAIWEPRTFKALTDVAKAKAVTEHIRGAEKVEYPTNIITVNNRKI